MRMTAIHAQTERKRQERSARRAEKHRRRSRTVPRRGLIRPVFAACATTADAQGEKRLSGGRIQAIFTSDGTTLGECRRIPVVFLLHLVDVPAQRASAWPLVHIGWLLVQLCSP